ncbi:MAG: hypothetical protein KF699_06175 [Phycisphaeraceae bacterium]|nr:hypothetical protein [Phycisphaeraceae bacterium]MBX3406618.1 hypothetical protein [Phycisphaeraceae bacterium]
MNSAHRLPAILLLCSAALLPACGSRITTGLIIPDGGIAEGRVLGAEPVVMLRNHGPETVDASVEDRTGRVFFARLGAGAAIRRNYEGPVRMTIQNKGLEQADFRVEAREADGVELKLLPMQ